MDEQVKQSTKKRQELEQQQKIQVGVTTSEVKREHIAGARSSRSQTLRNRRPRS